MVEELETDIRTITEKTIIELKYLDRVTTKEELIVAWKQKIREIQSSALRNISTRWKY